MADTQIAAGTTTHTLIAKMFFAFLTKVAVVVIEVVATVSTRLAAPVLQADVGRLGVVGGEHAAHDEEEVSNAAGLQSGTD